MGKVIVSFVVGAAFSAILLISVIYSHFLAGLSARDLFAPKDQLISQLMGPEVGSNIPKSISPAIERQLSQIIAVESARPGANPAFASQSFWNDFKAARQSKVISAFQDMQLLSRRQQLEEMTVDELLLELGQRTRIKARDDAWFDTYGKADREMVRARVVQLAEGYAASRRPPPPLAVPAPPVPVAKPRK